MAHIITGQEKVIIKAVSPDGSVSTGDLFVLSAANNGTTLVTIDGDLTVTGTQTINQSVSLQIEDKFLEVNRNNSTAGTEDSGIFFNQGTQNAAILYYDGADNEFLFGTTTNTPSDASISNITLANVKVATTPSDANHAASKSYVDSQVSTSNSIIMVGDDSTGTTLTQGETFKIAGTQNVTTAVSGDTLTVTGPDLTGYVTASSSNTFTNKSGNISQWTNDSAYITDANITIVGDDSTGVTLSAKNSDDFKIAGAQNVTTAISGNVLTITGPNLNDYITASSTNTLTNKTIDANGSGNSITNLEVADFAAASIVTSGEGIGSNNNDATIPTSAAVKAYADSVSGAGGSIMTFVGDDSNGTSLNSGETFKIAGGDGITTAVTGDTITITNSSTSQPITIVGDDSTGTTFNTGETFKIAGGTGITTAVSGDTLTVTNTYGAIANFSTVTGDSGNASAGSSNDTLTIRGGTGMTTSATGTTVTVNSTMFGNPVVVGSPSSGLSGSSTVSLSGTTLMEIYVAGELTVTLNNTGDHGKYCIYIKNTSSNESGVTIGGERLAIPGNLGIACELCVLENVAFLNVFTDNTQTGVTIVNLN